MLLATQILLQAHTMSQLVQVELVRQPQEQTDNQEAINLRFQQQVGQTLLCLDQLLEE
jgi:hypothetical protein